MNAENITLSSTDELANAIAKFIYTKIGINDGTVSFFKQHVEGFSWETYEIEICWVGDGTDHSREFIIHRVPEAGLLEPYNVKPLFELRKLMEDIEGVPVPAMLWMDEDGEATGRPLYVVEKIAGEIPTQWTSDQFFANNTLKESTSRQLMDICARIHTVPVELAPEGLRGSGASSFAMVDYWHEIYRNDMLEPVPTLDWGFAWLYQNKDRISERQTILHGDFRTGNYIMRDGKVVAVLDFEDAHIGDPVQDLAHFALRLFRGRTRQPSGLLPLREVVAVYEDKSGWSVPIEAFHFWSVFEAVYCAITQHRAASLFARNRTNDSRYPALGYQARHLDRYVLDYVTAAESGLPPE
jgi:aminoglycoside phosphotransferase (APT) family kinase protein